MHPSHSERDVELIVAEWDSQQAASQNVAIPLGELMELCAERARWEAKAEAMEEILETRMSSLERLLTMQQESYEKVLELTVKNARLETVVAMGGAYPNPGMQPSSAMAQWLPQAEPYGVPAIPNSPARLASHRPMPIPFAPSSHQCENPCSNAQTLECVIAREAACSTPCCEEGSHCCQDGSGKSCGNGQGNGVAPTMLRGEARLKFEASRKVP